MTDSPLTAILARRIALEGPIPLSEFMAVALGHPEHGYYRAAEPLGAAGDFVTAPEISQMFGELLGLWAAVAWQQMGAPDPVLLCELGPGRGTLMRDALRATAAVPGFHAALRLHLVETSAPLRARQEAALPGAAWHDRFETVPDGPLLLLANEFLDALPVRQLERRGGRWHERLVDWDDESARFRLGLAPGASPLAALLPGALASAPEGAIAELCPAAIALVTHLAERLRAARGAALLIDYGLATSSLGPTLQAVSRHGAADPLDRPGRVDLSAHVDFDALARAAAQAGAAVHGPVEQSVLLRRLGIEARAATLASAPGRAGEVAAALHRLIGPQEMGSLFKVMALTSPEAPAPPGFETEAGRDGQEIT